MPKEPPARHPPKDGAAEFDAVMRGLVQVPKAELEAEDRKYQAQRERLRQKKQSKPKRT